MKIYKCKMQAKIRKLMEQKILNKLQEIYNYNNKINRIKVEILNLKYNRQQVIITIFIHLEKILKAHTHPKIQKWSYLKKTK